MGQKCALIIATAEYQDTGLARLNAPGLDAHDFAGALRAPHIGAFDSVQMVLNETEPVARRAIARFFTGRKPDDLLLLYFSGHGVRDDHGQLYLAVSDTDRSLLSATAIHAGFVNEQMNESRSRRQVLILDCCNSGAFAQGSKAPVGGSMGIATAFEGTGYGRVVLTATDATQYAWEGDEARGEAANSVFTHFLVQGLETGEADANGDGRITLDELYDYVYEQVVTQTPRQTPRKFAYNQQGEVVIAHNPRPAARPVELPPELRQALESSLAGVREGVVQELAGLLRGSHRGLAAAAQEALERLANDDSRRVSTAAAAALAAQAAQAQAQRQAQAAEEALRAQAAAERLRLARERLEADQRRAAEKAAAEQAAEQKRLAQEKLEAERQAEVQRLAAEQERAEQARLAQARLEAQRQAEAQQAAAEERAEEERLTEAKAAADRQAETDRLAAEWVAAKRASAEKKAADEKAAQQRAAEQAERDRLAQAKAEAERDAVLQTQRFEREQVERRLREAINLRAEKADAQKPPAGPPADQARAWQAGRAQPGSTPPVSAPSDAASTEPGSRPAVKPAQPAPASPVPARATRLPAWSSIAPWVYTTLVTFAFGYAAKATTADLYGPITQLLEFDQEGEIAIAVTVSLTLAVGGLALFGALALMHRSLRGGRVLAAWLGWCLAAVVGRGLYLLAVLVLDWSVGPLANSVLIAGPPGLVAAWALLGAHKGARLGPAAVIVLGWVAAFYIYIFIYSEFSLSLFWHAAPLGAVGAAVTFWQARSLAASTAAETDETWQRFSPYWAPLLVAAAWGTALDLGYRLDSSLQSSIAEYGSLIGPAAGGLVKYTLMGLTLVVVLRLVRRPLSRPRALAVLAAWCVAGLLGIAFVFALLGVPAVIALGAAATLWIVFRGMAQPSRWRKARIVAFWSIVAVLGWWLALNLNSDQLYNYVIGFAAGLGSFAFFRLLKQLESTRSEHA